MFRRKNIYIDKKCTVHRCPWVNLIVNCYIDGSMVMFEEIFQTMYLNLILLGRNMYRIIFLGNIFVFSKHKLIMYQRV